MRAEDTYQADVHPETRDPLTTITEALADAHRYVGGLKVGSGAHMEANQRVVNALPALLEDYRAISEANRRNVGLLEVLERQGVELEAAKQAAASAECTRMHYRERAWRAESALERRMAERDALREALKAAIEQRDALLERWAALKAWAMAHQRDMLPGQEDAVIETMTELEASNVD